MSSELPGDRSTARLKRGALPTPRAEIERAERFEPGFEQEYGTDEGDLAPSDDNWAAGSHEKAAGPHPKSAQDDHT